jgi:hypothetical protein
VERWRRGCPALGTSLRELAVLGPDTVYELLAR